MSDETDVKRATDVLNKKIESLGLFTKQYAGIVGDIVRDIIARGTDEMTIEYDEDTDTAKITLDFGPYAPEGVVDFYVSIADIERISKALDNLISCER